MRASLTSAPQADEAGGFYANRLHAGANARKLRLRANQRGATEAPRGGPPITVRSTAALDGRDDAHRRDQLAAAPLARLSSQAVACPDCGQEQRIPPLPAGARAHCVRCRDVLAAASRDPLERPLALACAAAVALAVALTTPVLGLSAVGRSASTSLFGAVQQMWLHGQAMTALVVAFCTLLAPAAYLAALLAILVAVRRPPAPRWVATLLRVIGVVQPWSMNGVMMLGILVALIKISQLATVVPGTGFYAILALIVLTAAAVTQFDAREAWQRVTWSDGRPPPPSAPAGVALSGTVSVECSGADATKRRRVSCAHCALLVDAGEETAGSCPRCGAELAWRRRRSIERSWALLIAAAVFYVPANLLPVMTTVTPTQNEPETILSGVVYLYTSGSWPLALIVLVASVLIPLGKMVALGALLVSVQRRSPKNPQQRTQLYRLVELIGRWSMLDVFVDTFVVALVQLQPLMSVAPGDGVVYFMLVVIFTMLAAQSFDPRLIWDALPRPEPR